MKNKKEKREKNDKKNNKRNTGGQAFKSFVFKSTKKQILPVEMILMIASFLPSLSDVFHLSLVCKRHSRIIDLKNLFDSDKLEAKAFFYLFGQRIVQVDNNHATDLDLPPVRQISVYFQFGNKMSKHGPCKSYKIPVGEFERSPEHLASLHQEYSKHEQRFNNAKHKLVRIFTMRDHQLQQALIHLGTTYGWLACDSTFYNDILQIRTIYFDPFKEQQPFISQPQSLHIYNRDGDLDGDQWEYGMPATVTPYKAGKKEGIAKTFMNDWVSWQRWYKNDQLVYTEDYNLEHQPGHIVSARSYYRKPEEKERSEQYHSNGVMSQLLIFSSHHRLADRSKLATHKYQWGANGYLLFSMEPADNHMFRIKNFWPETGALRKQRQARDEKDLDHGFVEEFWEDGTKKAQLNMVDGKYLGPQQTWTRAGEMNELNFYIPRRNLERDPHLGRAPVLYITTIGEATHVTTSRPDWMNAQKMKRSQEGTAEKKAKREN